MSTVQKRIPPFVTITVLITFATGMIFGLSFGLQFLITNLLGFNDTFGKNAKIGPVSVAGLTQREAITKLGNETQGWYQNTKLNVIYKEVQKPLDPQVVVFDIKQSVEKASKDGSSRLIAHVEPIYYKEIIRNINAEPLNKGLDRMLFEQKLIGLGSSLQMGSKNIDLYQFIEKKYIEEPTVISESTISTADQGEMLQQWVENLNDSVIDPKATFSLMNDLQQNKITPVESVALDILASGLYQAVQKTNFELLERHTSLELPAYASIGQEAKVSPNDMDLVFKNPNLFSYKIQYEILPGKLKTKIVGIPLYYNYAINVKNNQTFNPKTIVQFSQQLPPGKKINKEAGKKGQMAKVYRTVTGPVGIVKESMLSEDFYPPVHRIEQWGPDIQQNDTQQTNNQTQQNQQQNTADQTKPQTQQKDGNKPDPSNSNTDKQTKSNETAKQ